MKQEIEKYLQTQTELTKQIIKTRKFGIKLAKILIIIGLVMLIFAISMVIISVMK